MADIQFDEENEFQRAAPVEEDAPTSLFVRAVLATGIVSTNKGAEHVLLAIAATAFIIAIALPLLIK